MNVSLASWLVSHFGVDRKLVRDIMLVWHSLLFYYSDVATCCDV
jgi:hypothetical protein